MFSNPGCVLSQCNTGLRLLYLLSKNHFITNWNNMFCTGRAWVFYPASCFKMIIYLLLFKGVICRWSSRSNGFLEVDLQYCRHPVKYHVLFKDSDLDVDKNFTIGENHKQTLYSNSLLGTVSIQVTELRRSRNTVTTSVRAMLVFIIFN